MSYIPERCSRRMMYLETLFRKNVENTRNGVPGYAHVGLTRHLRAQLGRLPDGQIDGFGQVVGEIKRLALYRSSKNEGKGNRLTRRGKRCGSGAGGAAAGAVATAAAVIIRTRLAWVALAASIGTFAAVGRFVVHIA